MMPGYFKVNILNMRETRQMFATEHQVPFDVTFEALTHHLNALRPADSEVNNQILNHMYRTLDETVEIFTGIADRRRPLLLRKWAQDYRFKLNAPGSERRAWHYLLHRFENPYVVAEGTLPHAVGSWKPFDGLNPLSHVKQGARQGKLPVFVRVKHLWFPLQMK